jgi:hypothetical protein
MLSRGGLFRDILSNREAHALMLNLLARGESDSAGGLDRHAARIREAPTRKRVWRHHEEEVRHGVLFTERLKRAGYEPQPIAPELDYVALLRKGGWGPPLPGPEADVPMPPEEQILLFCSSRVDEERGIREMSELKQALAADADTAATLEQILRDERGHVGYASFELKRLAKAGYGELIRRTLREYRRRESEVHEQVAAGFMERLTRILGYPAWVRWIYRAAIRVGHWFERLNPDLRIDATHLTADVKPLGHDIEAPSA